jgi:hypothetical protein
MTTITTHPTADWFETIRTELAAVWAATPLAIMIAALTPSQPPSLRA